MKNSVLRRPLATVLSLLMVIGLFTICGFGTLAADTAESAVIQSWTVEQLDAAAAAKGTQNQHSKPIYEKTGTPLGRHVVTVGGNWLFHSVMIPREQYNEGDKLVIKLLVWFNNASYGNVMPIEPQWVSTEPGVKTFISDQQINQAEIKTHPVYGYRYKEVEAEYTVTAADVADGITQMQVRVMLNGDEDINCYGGSIVNQTTGKTIFDWDGVAINGLGANTNDQTTVEAIRDNDNPYLASYAGPESYTARTNEPYASYNSDGLEEGEAILMDSLGAILGEGRYAFYFNMASQFSLGEKKVTYRAKDGDKVLAEQTIMLADVEATVGADTGTFEIRDLPFTVDAESAGHEITFEIVLHNSTDYYLKGVTLEKYVDPVSYTAAQLAASAEGLGADFDKVMGGQDETEIVGLTFNGAKTVIFTDLATEATIAGQYAFQAALASSNAADATLNAYVVEDDQPVLVESAKFTANTEGAASLAQVAFNVTDSMVGKQIVFGFEQADGSAVTLSGLNFVRLGDVQDPDPVLVKEWSAKDLGDNAEAKFRYNYQTKEAAVGYRVDGYVPNDPNDPETATYLVQWTRADVMSGALEERAPLCRTT